MKTIPLILLVLSVLVADQARAFDYRTLHAVRDRHTHIAILASLPPEGGDPPQRGTAQCARLDSLDRRDRNLAQSFGRLFQRSGIHFTRMLTSRVCRHIAAARTMALGPVTELPLLDPLPEGDEAEVKRRTDALLSMIEGYRPTETLMLITDRANIEALTGERLEVGEAVVFTLPPFGGELRVRGRFVLPQR